MKRLLSFKDDLLVSVQLGLTRRVARLSFVVALCGLGLSVHAQTNKASQPVEIEQKTFGKDYIKMCADNTHVLVSKRPDVKDRLFVSDAVEKKIKEVKKLLKDNPKLCWMFENCFPNTLETTAHYSVVDGDDDTFVYTGDIPAMWLRDSGAQVWPYVKLAGKDKKLKRLVRGTILRQFHCICVDPYANAFNPGPTGAGWQTDETKMQPEVFERKYEIDSLCYPIRLA